jgi:hypothetical protein
VPKFAKIFLFVAYLMLTVFSAEAAELWRLRYFVPTSAESEITFGSRSKAAEKLNTSGHSGNLVFANGIGVGYSTLRSNVSLEGVSYIFRNDSLDISYTIGNSLSFTFGAGRLINGRGELSLNGVSYATENSTGGAVFFNLGIPFIGGELLLGYRQNNIEYKNYQSQISGKTVTLADPVKLLSSQVSVGIGFIF